MSTTSGDAAGATPEPGASTADGAGRVSVIMPAYNAVRTLGASMSSVLRQSYRDIELVVVDDRSSDATWSRIQEAASADGRIVPLRQPINQGVAAARNAGIEAASGDYIAFLDSDDTWHPHKLASQVAYMRASSARICYTAYRRVDERGRMLSLVRPPRQIGYADMLRSNRIGNLTGIYDRAIGDGHFRRIGHEDYVFWLQMVRKAGTAHRLPDPSPMADYLVRDGSLSADKLKAAGWQWRIYRDIEKLGRVRSGWCFLQYAGNAVLKRR